MPVELTVPRLGESITEAVVARWHKKEGDPVLADEPVVALETDKVTIDVPAPAAGALEHISRKEGEKVKVGEVLGTIAPGVPSQAGRAAETQQRAPAPPAPPAPPTSAEARASTPLTPVAKRLAADRGVDPAAIAGSGPGGKILKGDVLAYLDHNAKPGASAAMQAPGGGEQALKAREERVKMTPLRRRVAERLLAAQQNAAILTTFNEVDMSEVMRLRKAYQERFVAKHGLKLGLMGFFVKACVEALRAYPQLNAEIDGDEVVFKHYYDIGVAVSGGRGLVVPVLRGADSLGLAEVEKGIAQLAERARSDKLTLEELQGGTFTVTNGGVFGSMLSTPILNPPQTGILGMHNIVERPVAREGQVVIRPVMYLALSYDHRLVDGREAVLFLVRVKECIEDPERLLLEV